MTPTSIVVVSDLHCNSTVALLAPHTKLQEGGEYALNPFQKWLWARWQLFLKQVPKGCVVVVNGDLVQGIHPTRELALVSPSATDMRRMAVDVLEPLAAKAKALYVIRGTPYHGGVGEQDTEAIAQEIGANAISDTGQYSSWNLWLDHDGLLFHFAHFLSVAPVYPLNPMQRELMNAKIISVDNGYPMPDVLVRSHRHEYKHYPESKRHVFATPGWQLQTDFVNSKMPMRLPSIGGLFLWVKKGELEYQPVLYPLPKPTVIRSR